MKSVVHPYTIIPHSGAAQPRNAGMQREKKGRGAGKEKEGERGRAKIKPAMNINQRVGPALNLSTFSLFSTSSSSLLHCKCKCRQPRAAQTATQKSTTPAMVTNVYPAPHKSSASSCGAYQPTQASNTHVLCHAAHGVVCNILCGMQYFVWYATQGASVGNINMQWCVTHVKSTCEKPSKKYTYCELNSVYKTKYIQLFLVTATCQKQIYMQGGTLGGGVPLHRRGGTATMIYIPIKVYTVYMHLDTTTASHTPLTQ